MSTRINKRRVIVLSSTHTAGTYLSHFSLQHSPLTRKKFVIYEKNNNQKTIPKFIVVFRLHLAPLPHSWPSNITLALLEWRNLEKTSGPMKRSQLRKAVGRETQRERRVNQVLRSFKIVYYYCVVRSCVRIIHKTNWLCGYLDCILVVEVSMCQ